MLDRYTVAVAVFAALFCSGCNWSQARYITKGPDTGEVAIPRDSPYFRKQARKLMGEHFPDGYEIVWEAEKVVGQTVKENTNTHHHKESVTLLPFDYSAKDKKYNMGLASYEPPSQHTTTTTTSFDKNEWRIQYRRKRDRSVSADGTSIGQLPSSGRSSGHTGAVDTIIPPNKNR